MVLFQFVLIYYKIDIIMSGVGLMYKILIVDDEDLVRKAIINKLNWQQIGFDVVEQAEDGEQALEIALQIKPDLVLTDVRMPFIDGLELAEKLSKELPATKVVILSGHDEFEYAQEAIRIGALDYVLKPINSIKLTELLTKITCNMDQEKLDKEKLVKIKRQLHQSFPLLKERFFNSLIHAALDKKEIESNIEFLEIDFMGNSLLICVAEVDNINIIAKERNAEDIALIHFSVLNIASELIGKFGFTFNDSLNRLVMVISKETVEMKDFENNCYRLLDEIRAAAEKYLKITITVGIGRIVTGLENMHLSYNDALTALDCKIIMGKNKVYNIKDLGFTENVQYFPIDKINTLISTIKLENADVVLKQLNLFFEDISKRKSMTSDNMRILMIELINGVQKVLIGIGNERGHEYRIDFKIYEEIGKCETLEDINIAISKFVSIVCESIFLSRKSRNSIIIEKAKQFIDENYSIEELSQNQVAGIVSVSPGYLSVLFRRETGETFVEYLTGVRMDKAKYLLKTTPLKAYEVAYKVGYSDPHYFSLTFKKHEGCTPSEYKNNN